MSRWIVQDPNHGYRFDRNRLLASTRSNNLAWPFHNAYRLHLPHKKADKRLHVVQ